MCPDYIIVQPPNKRHLGTSPGQATATFVFYRDAVEVENVLAIYIHESFIERLYFFPRESFIESFAVHMKLSALTNRTLTYVKLHWSC